MPGAGLPLAGSGRRPPAPAACTLTECVPPPKGPIRERGRERAGVRAVQEPTCLVVPEPQDEVAGGHGVASGHVDRDPVLGGPAPRAADSRARRQSVEGDDAINPDNPGHADAEPHGVRPDNRILLRGAVELLANSCNGLSHEHEDFLERPARELGAPGWMVPQVPCDVRPPHDQVGFLPIEG